MTYPATLEIRHVSNDEKVRVLTINSVEEYESIKNLHSSLDYVLTIKENRNIELKGTLFRIFQFIVRHNFTVSLGQIKREYLGSDISVVEAVEALQNMEMIEIHDNVVSVSDKGKSFFEDFQSRELSLINNLIFTDYDFTVIQFLYNRNDLVDLDDFPEILKEMAPQHGNSINDGNIIQSLHRLRNFVDRKNQLYMISNTGKEYFKNRQRNIQI